MSEKEAKRLIQELLFYNILIEKPRIKRLRNIYLLKEVPFYEELGIMKVSQIFKKYARSCNVETIDSNDSLTQLESSKSSVEDLLKDLLDEIRGFKYQITRVFLANTQKKNGNIESTSEYFNSTNKTVINSDKYMLDKSFQDIFCRNNDWILEGLGWVIESVDAEYVNISIFSRLLGGTYIELSRTLRNSMVDLINIKAMTVNAFIGFISVLNPIKIHLERIAKADKYMLIIWIIKALNSLSLKKILARLKRKIIFALVCFVMKIIWCIRFMYQIKNLKTVWIYW